MLNALSSLTHILNLRLSSLRNTQGMIHSYGIFLPNYSYSDILSHTYRNLEDMFDTSIQRRWQALLNTFWFVPGVISLLGPLLAVLLLIVDSTFHQTLIRYETFLFSGGAAEATSILSTIAGSLITVAGLAFSITIVVLQLVSSQYTPRALRGFLQDRITQFVAGGFFAIFSYSLVVLTDIHDSSPHDPGFIPTLSITIAMAFGFIGLMLLLIFIHHTGRVIQVSDIAARIATQTLQALDTIHSTQHTSTETESVSQLIQSWYQDEQATPVYAVQFGYVQHIALSQLIADITQPQLRIQLLVRTGDFVTEQTVIAEVWATTAVKESLIRMIQRHVHIERERDIAEDARFGVRQLADIALRALSPAINDPTTGVLCIKYLQVVFEKLARLPSPQSIIHVLRDTSTLIISQTAFNEYLEVFLEIGYYASGNTRVIEAILVVLTRLTEALAPLQKGEHPTVLAYISTNLVSHALTQIPAERDRTRIQEYLRKIEDTLNGLD